METAHEREALTPSSSQTLSSADLETKHAFCHDFLVSLNPQDGIVFLLWLESERLYRRSAIPEETHRKASRMTKPVGDERTSVDAFIIFILAEDLVVIVVIGFLVGLMLSKSKSGIRMK